MKVICCFLLLLCPYHSVAQNIKPVRPISVGDMVPDILFKEMANYKYPSANLSQFKGKLVILDFWATWCVNCIRKFPLLDSMQLAHPGDLQVILVNTADTRDTKQQIEKFFKIRAKIGNALSLPAAFNDSIAGNYFPHKFIPHYCWINKKGECIGITGADELTAQNIRDAINGIQPHFAGLSLMDEFDFQKPLFLNGNAGNGEGILSRSTLSKYIPGLLFTSRYSRNKENLITHYTITNSPLLSLVKFAYETDINDEEIQLSVTGSMHDALFPKTDSAAIANSYTYEIITPPLSRANILQYIRQDIRRYFGLLAKFEKRSGSAYAITIDSNRVAKHRSKNNLFANQLDTKTNTYSFNGSLPELIDYLNKKTGKKITQQAAINYNLSIKLPGASSLDILTTSLAGYGLFITPSTVPIEQFVIFQEPPDQPAE